jgi:hypothetical protein
MMPGSPPDMLGMTARSRSGEAHQVKFRPLGLGLAGLAALVTAAAAVAQTGPLPGPAPAAVAQLGQTPAPTPTASGRPQRGRRNGTPSPVPDATDSPVPAQFSTLDGVWEVEEQPLGSRRAKYSHLRLTQTGNLVNGYWEHDPNKTRSPLVGTFDGRLFQFTVDLGNGKSLTMAGYGENFSDFVGMMRTSPTDPGTPFTAQHRKKERPQ